LPPEDLILAFDTSAAHCAAALLLRERCVATRLEPMDKGQAERLFPLLEELLAEAGAAWRDLTAIGVGTGPGNFTGVRISVAAARGLALSLKVPAIGVSAFDALAHGLAHPLLASVDARRGLAYVARMGSDEVPVLCSPGDLPSDWAGLPIVGHDAAAFAAAQGGRMIGAAASPAEAIAREARARRGMEQPRPAPMYLRAADAAPSSDPPPVILP
jgi:tRNA threonylcarbamoyladenosine biosynthesis protein TsaB